ncbi:MAG TPA: hypothetical protein VFQ53_21465 [Kofleriaceae bacterium]|nr:hypothetical protein [Kofleriaceae bacterium]
MRQHVWILGLAFAALAACGGKKDDAGGGSNATDSGPRADVVESWKKAGVTVTPLAPVTVAFGKDCQSTTANNVDVVLCQYGSDDEAKAAEKSSLDWVGSTTGASWVQGKVVIAAADRKKADPNGRTINQLMKLAKK